jgi:hypothetical protein
VAIVPFNDLLHEASLETVDLARLVREIEAELRKSQPERRVAFACPDRVTAWGDPHLLRIALEKCHSGITGMTTNYQAVESA